MYRNYLYSAEKFFANTCYFFRQVRIARPGTDLDHYDYYVFAVTFYNSRCPISFVFMKVIAVGEKK